MGKVLTVLVAAAIAMGCAPEGRELNDTEMAMGEHLWRWMGSDPAEFDATASRILINYAEGDVVNDRCGGEAWGCVVVGGPEDIAEIWVSEREHHLMLLTVYHELLHLWMRRYVGHSDHHHEDSRWMELEWAVAAAPPDRPVSELRTGAVIIADEREAK